LHVCRLSLVACRLLLVVGRYLSSRVGAVAVSLPPFAKKEFNFMAARRHPAHFRRRGFPNLGMASSNLSKQPRATNLGMASSNLSKQPRAADARIPDILGYFKPSK
jgi:hypothetical protein